MNYTDAKGRQALLLSKTQESTNVFQYYKITDVHSKILKMHAQYFFNVLYLLKAEMFFFKIFWFL